MGSSAKNEDDQIISELDNLFPKKYNNALESTCRSISDSLNNSKKSSPESSAGKNILNDDIKTSNK